MASKIVSSIDRDRGFFWLCNARDCREQDDTARVDNPPQPAWARGWGINVSA